MELEIFDKNLTQEEIEEKIWRKIQKMKAIEAELSSYRTDLNILNTLARNLDDEHVLVPNPFESWKDYLKENPDTDLAKKPMKYQNKTLAKEVLLSCNFYQRNYKVVRYETE